jgi:hypothetical protein
MAPDVCADSITIYRNKYVYLQILPIAEEWQPGALLAITRASARFH